MRTGVAVRPVDAEIDWINFQYINRMFETFLSIHLLIECIDLAFLRRFIDIAVSFWTHPFLIDVA